MSGYCPDCGNTLCICDEATKATYPYRCRIKELEQKLTKLKNVAENESRMRQHYVERVLELEGKPEEMKEQSEIDKAEFEKWWMTTFHGLSTDETIRYRDLGKQSAMIGWAAAKLSCAKELTEKDKEIERLKDSLHWALNEILEPKFDDMTLDHCHLTIMQIRKQHNLNNGGQG